MQCDRKKPYTSKVQAAQAGKKARRVTRDRNILPYYCMQCLAWHIGHSQSQGARKCAVCGHMVTANKRKAHSYGCNSKSRPDEGRLVFV